MTEGGRGRTRAHRVWIAVFVLGIALVVVAPGSLPGGLPGSCVAARADPPCGVTPSPDVGAPQGSKPAPAFERAPANFERSLTTPFLSGSGAVRLLFHPEFRSASSLLEDLNRFGIEGLTADLVGPLVPSIVPGRPPVASRLVLIGEPELVSRGREVLHHLDVPKPTVLVSLLAVEVECIQDREIGGSFAFDRDSVPESPNTLFRGIYSEFEPDAYLRSSLTGARPFAGTSVAFGTAGKKLLKFGAIEYVLRLLQMEEQAEFLAWPSVVCSEGMEGSVTSWVHLEVDVISEITRREGGAGESAVTTSEVVVPRTEQTGVRFAVTPIQIGTDTVRLKLDADLRFPQPERSDGMAATTLLVRKRNVTTELSLADQETLLVGGLKLRRKLNKKRGLPVLGCVPGFNTKTSEYVDTELVLLVRARIVVPGRSAELGNFLPPGEARRLDRLAHGEPPAEVRAQVPALPACPPACLPAPCLPAPQAPQAPPCPPPPPPPPRAVAGVKVVGAAAAPPLPLADDVARLEALFAPGARQGRGPALSYGSGAHRLDPVLLARLDPFPAGFVIEGAGIDETLLRLPPWTRIGRGDVHGLTFRNLTLHLGNAPLHVSDGRFSLRLERCRVIGFDRRLPGGPLLIGGSGVLYATHCRFEGGWGTAPGMGELFALRGSFTARVEDSLIRGPLLSLHQRERADQRFVRCRFVDLPRERKAHLTAEHPTVRFVESTFAWLPPGADLFPPPRLLSELHPNWR